MAALNSLAYCWLELAARSFNLAASESLEAVRVGFAFPRAWALISFRATSWNCKERKPREAMHRSAKQVGCDKYDTTLSSATNRVESVTAGVLT